MLIDLHAHTRVHSWDSSLSPDDLIDGAKDAGLHGICLTEHDQFWSHDDARQLAKRHNFLVIPGCEITTEEGHVLVFGLGRYEFGMHRARTLKGLADRSGGAMLFAHPYRRQLIEDVADWAPPYDEQVRKACANAAMDVAHAVETMNGRGSKRQNVFSHDVCRRRGLPAVGASDSHERKDIGACATAFDSCITGLEDLIAALRSGRYHPVDLRNGHH